MKINEIIVEGPFDAMKQAVSDIKQGYQSGYRSVDNLLSPSKWGQSASGQEKSATFKDKQPKALSNHAIRDLLTRTGSNDTLYRDDINNLKLIYTEIKNNKIKTDDPEHIMQIIKRAYTGNNLSNEEGQELIDLSQKF